MEKRNWDWILSAFPGAAVAVGGVWAIVGMITAASPLDSNHCSWVERGLAYVDGNQNSVFDVEDMPLEGVTFHVDELISKRVDMAHMASDKQGKVYFTALLGGCPKTDLEVYVDVPAGYVLSGPQRLKSDETHNKALEFGFWQMR